ncbi:MAG TPA: substrate-binding domain-containing protein, partial [Geminicoccaceae bacterium]|nr:substrate-binding domain-containing protein [Geminicoccaceae bacterium]
GIAAVLGIDIQNADQAQQRIAQAVRDSTADGILTLGTASARPALAALRAGFGRRVQMATFDLSPEALEAVRVRRMLFAVDQQPYLQGYLPVVFLTQNAKYHVLPSGTVQTGPLFVTQENAAQVIELSAKGIR